MANEEAVNAALNGTSALIHWERLNPDALMDLSGADLRGASLRWMNFAGATLDGADLSYADLAGAYFGPDAIQLAEPVVRNTNRPALLRDTRFANANLLAATFNYADLTNADFRKAKLGLVNFRRCVMHGADLDGAALMNTSFVNQDLGGVRGLANIEHKAPSFADLSSLLRSDPGSLPDSFLDGIGISKHVRAGLIALLASQPAETHQSVFVSHATADQEFCDKLFERLRAAGLQVWYAPHDMKAGRQVFSQIEDAIQVHDRVLLVLSSASITSNWVANEIRLSRHRERAGGGQVLFPISLVPFAALRDWTLLDADSGEDHARTVRQYFIPDFSNWRDVEYFEKEIARLLASLRQSSQADAALRRGAVTHHH